MRDVRWGGDADLPVVTAVVAFAALMFAVGAVCGIQFVIGDFYENWSRHRQTCCQRQVIWHDPTRPEAERTSVSSSDVSNNEGAGLDGIL